MKCLKDEGIYVWLDLHVGRKFLPEATTSRGIAELAQAARIGQGFQLREPAHREADARVRRPSTSPRTNRYTGKRYTDEPALAFVLITNENDLTHHFGAAMLPDKGNPVHTQLFDALAKEFAKARRACSAAASRKSWAPGPGKIAAQRNRASLRSTCHRPPARRRASRRSIATTSFWGEEALCTVCLRWRPAMSSMCIRTARPSASGVNPHYEANFVSWIGAAQVAGKPLSITEWNVEYPNRDRFVAPLYVAAIAALQGWDAPMIYGYTQTGIQQPDTADAWSTWNDPALMALDAGGGVHVSAGATCGRRRRPIASISRARSSTARARARPERCASHARRAEQAHHRARRRPRARVGRRAFRARAADASRSPTVDRDFLPPGQSFVVSDTGELKRDWSLGIETIDTPKSQAVMGWVGKRALRLTDVTFDLETPKATVAVTSLDGQPIASSKKMLVTVVAQVATCIGR